MQWAILLNEDIQEACLYKISEELEVADDGIVKEAIRYAKLGKCGRTLEQVVEDIEGFWTSKVYVFVESNIGKALAYFMRYAESCGKTVAFRNNSYYFITEECNSGNILVMQATNKIFFKNRLMEGAIYENVNVIAEYYPNQTGVIEVNPENEVRAMVMAVSYVPLRCYKAIDRNSALKEFLRYIQKREEGKGLWVRLQMN